MHVIFHMLNIGLYHHITHLSMLSGIAILVGNFWLVMPSLSKAADQTKTPAQSGDDDSDDWMFDKSTYTNDPKTGHRVDQYKKEKTPYRDPNALFDSPMNAFPFYDSWGGGYYGYEPFFYENYWPELYNEASRYYYGEDGSGYYPYDGDPNNEEDSK